MINFGAVSLLMNNSLMHRRRMRQLSQQNTENDNTENIVLGEAVYWQAMNHDAEGRASLWKCSKCGYVVQFAQKTEHWPCMECPKCGAEPV